MPELPEVAALVTSLDRELRDRRVQQAAMRSFAALKTFDPPFDALEGRRIAGATRFGKFVGVDLGGLWLVVHLARAGWLRHRRQPTTARPSQRGPLLMVLLLDDGSALEATEQGTEKRLAVWVVRDPGDVPGIARLGIDALDPGLDVDRLSSILGAAPGTLKSALADQERVAGIGNAYSDEILHAARLSPFRRAAGLDRDEAIRLHAALRSVLGGAVERAALVPPDQLRGDKKLRIQVHGRTGEPCPVCGTAIRQVSFSNRSLQYCPTCQTGGRVYADRRLSKLLR
jgi:formamidopyrimidine-DNA glycosylase